MRRRSESSHASDQDYRKKETPDPFEVMTIENSENWRSLDNCFDHVHETLRKKDLEFK